MLVPECAQRGTGRRSAFQGVRVVPQRALRDRPVGLRPSRPVGGVVDNRYRPLPVRADEHHRAFRTHALHARLHDSHTPHAIRPLSCGRSPEHVHGSCARLPDPLPSGPEPPLRTFAHQPRGHEHHRHGGSHHAAHGGKRRILFEPATLPHRRGRAARGQERQEADRLGSHHLEDAQHQPQRGRPGTRHRPVHADDHAAAHRHASRTRGTHERRDRRAAQPVRRHDGLRPFLVRRDHGGGKRTCHRGEERLPRHRSATAQGR